MVQAAHFAEVAPMRSRERDAGGHVDDDLDGRIPGAVPPQRGGSKRGDRERAQGDDLEAAVHAQAQAELVAARCMDARVGPGSEWVEISIKKPAPRSEPPAPRSPEFPVVELSHETERAFAWLRRQCPLNPDLEKHLVGYAKMLGMR